MPPTRSLAVFAILLGIGLAVFGFQVGRAVQLGRSFDRYLTVKGLSEREVKATLAIWPIRFAASAEDLPGLQASVAGSRRIVLEFLAANDIPASEVSFGIPSVTDRLENRYGSHTPDDLPRYKAVSTLVVRSSRVDVVKAAIQGTDALLERGIVLAGDGYGDTPAFIFEGINAVKPAMIEEATQAARAAAGRFAADSSATVGRIRRATQGALEIQDRDAASPEIKVLRVVTTVDFFID